VGPRAGLDRCGKPRPTGIRSPDLPARSHSPYRLSYPAHRSSWAGAQMMVFWVSIAVYYRKFVPTIQGKVLPLRCGDWLTGCTWITDRKAAKL